MTSYEFDKKNWMPLGNISSWRKRGTENYIRITVGALIVLMLLHGLLVARNEGRDLGSGRKLTLEFLIEPLAQVNASSSPDLFLALETASLTSLQNESRPFTSSSALDQPPTATSASSAFEETSLLQRESQEGQRRGEDSSEPVKDLVPNETQKNDSEQRSQSTEGKQLESNSEKEGPKEGVETEGNENDNKTQRDEKEGAQGQSVEGETTKGEDKKTKSLEKNGAEERDKQTEKKVEKSSTKDSEGSRREEGDSEAQKDEIPAHQDLLPGAEGSRDWEEVAKLRELMRPLAKNNTVVVTPANKGFLDLVLNLRCRLLSLGWTQTLFWALDQASADRFQAEGIPFYYDPTLFSTSNVKGYHDPDYIRMMSERPRVWWRLVATGFDLLFLDADVVAFESPDRYFDRTADLEGQVNGWGWEFEKSKTTATNLCAGAFWIRSSEKSLRFLEQAYRSFEERRGHVERWDDQLALNWVLHNESVSAVITAGVPQGQKYRLDVEPHIFKVAFIEPERILPGHLYWGTKMTGSGYNVSFSIKVKETDAEPLVFSPSLFHMSGHGEKSQKVERMKQLGWWELDEKEGCREQGHSS